MSRLELTIYYLNSQVPKPTLFPKNTKNMFAQKSWKLYHIKSSLQYLVKMRRQIQRATMAERETNASAPRNPTFTDSKLRPV